MANKKLKEILKESNVWDRDFGDSLPTLKDCEERFAKKQGKEVTEDKCESTWTWVYKGLLSGFKKSKEKRLEVVARAVSFLIKTQFGRAAKNDFIKAFNKSLL